MSRWHRAACLQVPALPPRAHAWRPDRRPPRRALLQRQEPLSADGLLARGGRVSVTYQREAIATVRAEIEPMLAAHHAETAVFGDEFPLAPNLAAYERLEQLG